MITVIKIIIRKVGERKEITKIIMVNQMYQNEYIYILFFCLYISLNDITYNIITIEQENYGKTYDVLISLFLSTLLPS